MSQRGPEAVNVADRGGWRSLTATLAGLLLCATGTPGLALPEDRSQPIHISADQAIRDEKQGYTVYQGHVQMSQGSLKISAGKLTVFHEIEEADRIMAEGSPAHLQQRPGTGKGMMHARAKVIEYFKAEERILLRHDASIEQDGSRVAGESIEYFIDQQLIKADSERTSETGDGGKGRVQVVIPASNLPQASDKGTEPAAQTKQEDASGATDRQ